MIPSMRAHLITPESVQRRLAHGEQVLFVDTRNPTAWANSRQLLPNAIRIAAAEVPNHLGELPHDRAIVTYCT
jgi:rhodanese-related sulfurtransferase